jgi:hypothetical protein
VPRKSAFIQSGEAILSNKGMMCFGWTYHKKPGSIFGVDIQKYQTPFTFYVGGVIVLLLNGFVCDRGIYTFLCHEGDILGVNVLQMLF